MTLDAPEQKILDSFSRQLGDLSGSFVVAISKIASSKALQCPERSLDRDSVLLDRIREYRTEVQALRQQWRIQHSIHPLTSRDYTILMGAYQDTLSSISGRGFDRTERMLRSLFWRSRGMACWLTKRGDSVYPRGRSVIGLRAASFAILLWYATSDFGHSIVRWCLSVLVIIAFLGLIYMQTPSWLEPIFPSWAGSLRPRIARSDGTQPQSIECLYFSGVTFTSLGYGDVCPANGAAMILAVIEAGIGLTMFVVLGHMLSRLVIIRRMPATALLDGTDNQEREA